MVFQVSDFNRKTFLYYLENLSPKQLFFTPKNFKNNIIWNIAHVLITEQMLTYGVAGLDLPVAKKFVKMYAKGTLSTSIISKDQIKEVKTQLIPAINETKKDYKKGTFKNYNEYSTSVGITLKNIEEALQFNAFHEGIHIGIILSIQKLLK